MGASHSMARKKNLNITQPLQFQYCEDDKINMAYTLMVQPVLEINQRRGEQASALSNGIGVQIIASAHLSIEMTRSRNSKSLNAERFMQNQENDYISVPKLEGPIYQSLLPKTLVKF